MFNKVYEFCKKANYVMIFIILFTIWISIVSVIIGGHKEGGRYNRTKPPETLNEQHRID